MSRRLPAADSHLLHIALSVVSLITLSIGTMQPAIAQDSSSTIIAHARVESKDEPQKAIGMVLSSTSSQQYPGATVSKVGEKLYDISFAVEKATLTADSVSTAIAFTEKGDIVFANVTPPLNDQNHALLASIPECPADDSTHVALLNQIGPLQQLVDVRAERVKFARLRLDRALTDDVRARLKKAEQVFGLSSSEELSSNLPALELVDRLSRISFALKNYRAFKKPTPAAPAAAPE